MSMRILEVSFDDHVRRPENRHNTNVLRLARENDIGVASVVDTLEESALGIRATKTVVDSYGNRTTFASLYPWPLVRDVKYEPVVALAPVPDAFEEPKPEPKPGKKSA